MSPLVPSEWQSIEAPVMRPDAGPAQPGDPRADRRRAYPGLAEGLAPLALASKRAWTVTDADDNVYLDLALGLGLGMVGAAARS